MTRSVLGLTFALVLAAPAYALHTVRYSGKGSDGSFISLVVAARPNGTPVRIKHFEWDGLHCTQDSFTGGTSHAVRVRDRRFHSRQPVGGANVPLTMKLRGSFNADASRVSGVVRVLAGCDSGPIRFKAKPD